MKKSGNSDPRVCVENLIKTIRGEVPYERIKGINRELIDKPASVANSQMVADVQWLIETYEPRVDVSEIDIEGLVAELGGFAVDTSVVLTEEGAQS